MEFSTEATLDVSFEQDLPSAMAELSLLVWRVHPHWGFKQLTHNIFLRRPSSHLLLPQAAESMVSSVLFQVPFPSEADMVFWIGNISSYVQSVATEAYQSGLSSFLVSAEISIFEPEPPQWIFQQVAAVAASVFVQWLQLQEREELDQVLLLSAEEASRVPPRRPSSPVTKLESLKYKQGDESGTTTTTTTTNCVICMDDFEQGSKLSKTPCSHVFHESCLERWLQESHACPLCRFSLSAETERPMLAE